MQKIRKSIVLTILVVDEREDSEILLQTYRFFINLDVSEAIALSSFSLIISNTRNDQKLIGLIYQISSDAPWDYEIPSHHAVVYCLNLQYSIAPGDQVSFFMKDLYSSFAE